MNQWPLPIKQPSTFDVIKYAVNNYEWQKFRLSLKGISTQEKLIRLSQWRQSAADDYAAKVQVDNYLGALKRGGQISNTGEILK